MRSICIKINNPRVIEYLLEKLNGIELDDFYFSCKKFKIYHNIILHFKGRNEKLFLKTISKILAFLVIELYEEKIINTLIKSEYFYFNNFEQKQIAEISLEDLYDANESVYSEKKRFNMLYNRFYEYLTSHHSIVLKGFITFRIKNYFEALLEQIDKSVNKYIIEKEYTEFISLLKMYVSSEPSSIEIIHLVYSNCKSTLLDENKNAIKIEDDVFNAKYLSDISFSSNDYALNTLLSLLPHRIYIHLIDGIRDEFINTIKLIFEDRVTVCTDCSICKMYKSGNLGTVL